MVISITKVIRLSIDDTKNYFNFILKKKKIHLHTFGKAEDTSGLRDKLMPSEICPRFGPTKKPAL